MDIVLSLLLFFSGVALTGVAAWRSFDTGIDVAVEKSKAVAQTAATGFIGLTLVAGGCSMLLL